MKRFLFAILIVVLMAGTAVGSVLIYHYTEGSKNEITILKNEKGTILASERKAKNGKEVELSCVAKDGYELSYYTVDGEQIEGSSFIMPDKRVEVSAEFKVINYTITYQNINEYATNTNTIAEYNIESSDIILEEPTKAGYAFVGWYKESDFVNKLTEISTGSHGNLTLYAKWESMFVYNTSGEITALTEYAKNNKVETFRIPNSIDGQAITKVGNNLNITSDNCDNIVLEKGITSIGENVFKKTSSSNQVKKIMYTGKLSDWCAINFAAETSTPTIFCAGGADFYINDTHISGKIELPQIYEIKDYTFYSVSDITEVVIPTTASYVGKSAFEDCYGLSKANLSRIVIFNNSAFKNCKNLTDIGKFELAQRIEDYAFYNTWLTNVSFGMYLTTIGDSAFRDSRITTVNLRAYRLTSVGDYAFCNSNVKTLVVDTLYDVTFGEKTFAGNIWLANIYLEASTGAVIIQETTFEYCNIENIYISYHLIDTYKVNEDWINYVSLMKNLSEAV